MRGWLHIARLTAIASLPLASFTTAPQSARAAAPDGVFAVEESGRMPCPAFVAAKAKNSPAFTRAIGFIEGYISAANRYEANTFDLSPWHTGQAYGLILEQHCKAHASDTIGMAAQRLVAALQPLRLASPSKLIEVGNGKHKAVLYEAILKRAQSALARRGLYRGAASGTFDAPTQKAFAAFQSGASLQPTGVPDPATLWKLLNP
ncbi:peptidoglycan-binding protein [Novosphingobium sp. TH158]|uniref:peptidoglycan-binding domain-containing protein n=1 Tax=Novosphingobium sp. TH158 TaxID=2067455 RepID=UPI000C7CDAC3|nr:peptidoglycan-binding domain-containing protein [Novosphingobium sp. TH158]PLK26995.1 hypothetical protein C0V78_08930 [Novosphingobium sp. TH158]